MSFLFVSVLACIFMPKKSKKFSIIFLLYDLVVNIRHQHEQTGQSSAVRNVSDNRYESDCRSRGSDFDPGLVPYFLGD